MFASSLTLKIVVTVSIAVTTVVAGVAVVTNLQQSYTKEITFSPEINYALDITPSIELDKRVLGCSSTDKLKANISAPNNNQSLYVGSAVQYSGSFKFPCAEIAAGDVKYEWKLNGESFDGKAKGTLDDLGIGEYKLSLKITFQDWTDSATTNFQVVKQPNKSPTAKITSKNVVAQGITHLAYYLVATGTGTDPEQGNLTGNDLKWFIEYDQKGSWIKYNGGNHFATGSDMSINIGSFPRGTNLFKITLKATDNQGLSHSTSTIIDYYDYV